MKVSISVPTNALSGTVTVTATATTTVNRMQFYIDGVLKATDSVSPYSYAWDTTTVEDGTHVISVKAFYGRNQTQDDQVTRTVRNVSLPPPPPPAPLQPPVNTVAPAITGTATDGQTLTVSSGTWTNSPTSFTRQWTRCDAAGANCNMVPAATGTSYTLHAADVGSTIRCWTSAFNSAGASAPILSAQTGVVAALAPSVPVLVTAPVITGTATRGNTLTISSGSWTNSPTSYTHQWLICNPATGESCTSPTGEDRTTYVLTSADVGKVIRCWTTAFNGSGQSTAVRSVATGVVEEPAVGGWTFSANEGGACVFTGTKEIRFGAGNQFTAPRVLASGTLCTNAVFGDPAPGVSKHCEIRDAVAPPPPPPPPPPPTGKQLRYISDFQGWGHLHLDKISEVSTPQGPGLRFLCDFPSGSGDGVQLVDVNHLVPWASWNGFLFDLSGYLTVPTAGNTSGFPDFGDWNCLAEFGATGQDSFVANQFGIDGRPGIDPTIYARTLTPGGGGYTKYSAGAKIVLGAATPFRWRLRLTTSASGTAEFWWNGTKIMDFTGPTMGSGWSNPWFHLGFYSGNVISNEVIYSGMWLA